MGAVVPDRLSVPRNNVLLILPARSRSRARHCAPSLRSLAAGWPLAGHYAAPLSLEAVGRSYPRDVVAGVATARPRTAPCREKAVRRAAALTRLAPAPKEVCILQLPPFARPAGPINVGLGAAAPVRLRRPYNKDNYSPRASTLCRYEPPHTAHLLLYNNATYCM